MKIQVFLGSGGVGKTSMAAASALKAALGGQKCLVLAIDPALRLRTALGMKPGSEQQRVPLEDASGQGQLWGSLLDVRYTLDRAVRQYGKAKQAETVLNHPIYQILIDSLVGMPELMAIERLDQAVSDGFDSVVIDTAPSRHALEFLDKPEFFVQLVTFPLVQLVGRLYKIWDRSPLASLSRKGLELYSRVEALLGATLVRQILDFYSIFFTIAEGYAEHARKTVALLRDPRVTSFHIVTSPAKAIRDAEFFLSELGQRKFPVASLAVNRFWFPAAGPAGNMTPSVTQALEWYRDVSQTHERLWGTLEDRFARRIPSLLRVPELSRDIDGLPALREIARYVGEGRKQG